MNEIYIPNVFRYENIRKNNYEEVVSNIPYFIDFDLNDEKQFSAMKNFELANIIENILLFDRVYVDSIILPILIDLMYEQDYKGTIKLIKKGYISFIDCQDMSVSASKSNDGFAISLGLGKQYNLKNIKDLESFILGYGVKKDKLRPYISRIYENKKTIDLDAKDLGKEIVNKIDFEIKSGMYRKIGIGVNGNYAIDKNNKGIFDTICQVVKAEKLASICCINSINYNDIVLEISKIRSDVDNREFENFKQLISFNDIPDIASLYLQGNLSISDVVALKSSSEFKAFKKWFNNSGKADKDKVIKDYHAATKKKSKLDSIPAKVIRMITTTAASVEPVLGTIATIADSFGVDYIKGKTPDLFFNDIEKRYKQNSKKNKDVESVIVPIRTRVEVDTSKERKLDLQEDTYNRLLYYGDKIYNSNNENECIKYFEEARCVYERFQTKRTLEGYLCCIVNLSNKSIVYCAKFIEDIGEYIKNLRIQNEVVCMDIVQDSYMSVLLNGISKGLESMLVNNMKDLVDNDICIYKMGNFIKHILIYGTESDTEYVKKLASILLYSIGKTDKLCDIENICEVSVTDSNEIKINYHN